MAYQALYRKYRPSTFDDVVGQEHITQTLKNELANQKLVHAYLFTGTRGTGKTSCAKILAKAVNCLTPINGNPCGECEMCRAITAEQITDIEEIDAASNNGVDYIRELREQVNFTPAAAKYRVYIIDEVHMLSASAFNALLKTLEEPPSHVVFILATTEVHKLPPTILSRCQRFDFRRIDAEKICERLSNIAEVEGFNITKDAATLIAHAADGGMRDAISILDLCAANSQNIDEDVVASVCSMAGNDYLIKLADLISAKDLEGALLLIDELHNSSVDMLRLLSELTRHYRDLMIVKTVKSAKRPIVCSASRQKELERQANEYNIKYIMSVLQILQSAAGAIQYGNRRCEMEMTVIKLCSPQDFTDLSTLELRIADIERRLSNGIPTIGCDPTYPAEQKQQDIIDAHTLQDDRNAEDDIPIPQSADILPDEDVQEQMPPYLTQPASAVKKPNESETEVSRWNDILEILKKSCPLIAGVLEDSRAYTKGSYLLIDAPNSQFRTLINSNNTLYRDSIRKAAEKILGTTYKLGPYHPQAENKSDPLEAFAEKLKKLENKN